MVKQICTYVFLILIFSATLGCNVDNSLKGEFGNASLNGQLFFESKGDGTGTKFSNSLSLNISENVEIYTVLRGDDGTFISTQKVSWVYLGNNGSLVVQNSGHSAHFVASQVGSAQITATINGVSYSLTVNVYPALPPPDPISVLATATGLDSIQLSWFSGGGSTVGYRISYLSGSSAPLDCNSGTVISENMIFGTSHSLTSLTQGTQYTFLICAINGNSPTDLSVGTITFASTWAPPPPDPISFTAQVMSSSEALLSWSYGGGSTAGYRLAYDTGPTPPGDCSSGTTISEYAIIGQKRYLYGLDPSTQYSFRLCSINDNPVPVESPGPTLSFTTYGLLPPDPIGPSAVKDSDTQLTLNWTTGGGSTAGYRIAYYEGEVPPPSCQVGNQINEGSIVGTSHTFSGLAINTSYSFRVCAVDGASSVSAGVTVTEYPTMALPPGPVPTPGVNIVTNITSQDFTLSFRLPSAPIKNQVRLRADLGSTPPADCNAAADLDLNLFVNTQDVIINKVFYLQGLPNTEYSGIICTSNATGFTTSPLVFSVTLPPEGPTPGDPVDPIIYDDTGSISILRAKMGFPAGVYRIAVQWALGVTPPPVNCPTPDDYIESPNVSQTLWNPSLFNHSQNYTFRFCSLSQPGGQPSPGTVITFNRPPVGSAPPNPTGLTITTPSLGKFEVEVTSLPAAAAKYRIAYQLGSTPPSTCLSGNSTSRDIPNNEGTSTYMFSTNRNNTEYSFRVCSSSAHNELSSPGLTASATSMAGTAAAPNPTELTANILSSTQVSLEWLSSGGDTTGYQVSFVTGPTPPATCFDGSPQNSNNSPQHTITGLSPSTQYSFLVCSKNSDTPNPTLSSGASLTITMPASDPTAPPDVTNLTATASSESSITLSWDSGGGSTANYRIAPAGNAKCQSSVTAIEGSFSGTSYTVTGLSPGKEYDFIVCAATNGPSPIFADGVSAKAYTHLTPSALVVAAYENPSPSSLTDVYYILGFVGDLDVDGQADIAVANDSKVSTYKFNPDNSLSALPAAVNIQANSVVEGIGDFDHDGYGDYISGSAIIDSTNNQGQSLGQVTINSGRTGDVLWQKVGPHTGSRFGHSFSEIGDVDGDGTLDALIGAPGNFDVLNNAGKISILSGATGLEIHSRDGYNENDEFGSQVDNLGDLNGDTKLDFLATSPMFDGSAGSKAGKIYIYSGLDYSIMFQIEGEQADSQFGFSAASAGDYNNDGVGDFVVGAPLYDGTNGTDCGKMYIYSGQSGNLIYSFEGETAGDQLGYAVADAGDMNTDLFSDIVVGAPFYNPQSSGKIYVFSGRDNSILLSPIGTLQRNFGIHASKLGDVNGDGKNDLGIAGREHYMIINLGP